MAKQASQQNAGSQSIGVGNRQITFPSGWGYQEYTALSWFSAQVCQLANENILGLSNAMIAGGSTSPPGGNQPAQILDTQEQPNQKPRGRRKMTAAQRRAHQKRMQEVAARRKAELEAQQRGAGGRAKSANA